MSDTQSESASVETEDIEDSEAVITDSDGRIRFRTLRVNKGSGERNGDENE